jgi:hypothetical protein
VPAAGSWVYPATSEPGKGTTMVIGLPGLGSVARRRTFQCACSKRLDSCRRVTESGIFTDSRQRPPFGLTSHTHRSGWPGAAATQLNGAD